MYTANVQAFGLYPFFYMFIYENQSTAMWLHLPIADALQSQKASKIAPDTWDMDIYMVFKAGFDS